MNFDQQIRQLQDTAVVMAEIQRRQAEVQKLQAEEVESVRESIRSMREGFDLHERRMNHIDIRLAEITDKLDGLIGFMGGHFKGPN